MVGREACDIPYLSVDDYPTIGVGIVLCDLGHRQQLGLSHVCNNYISIYYHGQAICTRVVQCEGELCPMKERERQTPKGKAQTTRSLAAQTERETRGNKSQRELFMTVNPRGRQLTAWPPQFLRQSRTFPPPPPPPPKTAANFVVRRR